MEKDFQEVSSQELLELYNKTENFIDFLDKEIKQNGNEG